MIAAASVFIHQRVLKFNTEVFIRILLDFQERLLAVFLADQDIDLLLIHQILVIKYILNVNAVHRDKIHSGLDAHLPGYAVRIYLYNSVSVLLHGFSRKL